MNIVIIILVAVFAAAFAWDAYHIHKSVSHRKKLLSQGTPFEGEVIGVARKNRVIAAEGLSSKAFVGSEKENITGKYGQDKVEDYGESRVKISFIHPETGLPTTIRTVLRRSDCGDSRIRRISHPKANLKRKERVIRTHNRQLLTRYRKNVETRPLSKQEKQVLIREAKHAQETYYDKYYGILREDMEGYTVLVPSIAIQGYYRDGDYLFIQKTNTPILEDWTANLA